MTKVVLLGLIHGYQRFISPLFPPQCRFQPTCSTYALDAIANHGVLKGSWLTTQRICRCHPFHPGGYDPVPPVKGKAKDRLRRERSVERGQEAEGNSQDKV